MNEDELAKIAFLHMFIQNGEAKALRQRSRVTQRQLAERLFVNTSTLSLWERGKHKPSGRDALRYLEALRLLMRVKTAYEMAWQAGYASGSAVSRPPSPVGEEE